MGFFADEDVGEREDYFMLRKDLVQLFFSNLMIIFDFAIALAISHS
jgi:hypothetical protein